jgi:hypothetical protein
MPWKELAPYIVPLLIVAIVARRLIRNEPRKVNTGRMFLFPAIIAIGTVTTLANSPMPQLFWLVGFAVAVAAGSGVGYLNSRHRELAIDFETGIITSKATPIGMILFVGLFALRFGMRIVFPQLAGGGGHMAHPSRDLIGWTDAGLIFSTAMVVAAALTMYLRTRPLLAAHAQHKAASSPP